MTGSLRLRIILSFSMLFVLVAPIGSAPILKFGIQCQYVYFSGFNVAAPSFDGFNIMFRSL